MGEAIAIMSLLVAGLSALYARHSVTEVRKENDIALHEDRARIYRGVVEFGHKLVVKGEHITEDDLCSFDASVQLSEFYYEKDIYKQLDSIYVASTQLITKHEEWVRSDDSCKKLAIKEEIKELLGTLRSSYQEANSELRDVLRVAKPANWVV